MVHNQNACPHPWDDTGRVCDPERAEPGEEWELRVWSCWWVAKACKGPAFTDKMRERPEYGKGKPPPPPPRRPALH